MKEVKQCKEILECYYKASGEQINFHKSSLMFSTNCMPKLKVHIKENFGCEVMKERDIYLGILALWGKSKWDIMKYIMERVKLKPQSWKQKLHSMVGKEIMINAIL